jgi:hypothetical protein
MRRESSTTETPCGFYISSHQGTRNKHYAHCTWRILNGIFMPSVCKTISYECPAKTSSGWRDSKGVRGRSMARVKKPKPNYERVYRSQIRSGR